MSSSSHSLIIHGEGDATPPRSAAFALAAAHAHPTRAPLPSPPASAAAALAAAAALHAAAAFIHPAANIRKARSAYTDAHLAAGGYDSDEEEDGGSGHFGAARMAARADVNHFSQRWVPWKQTNGVAVYHHEQADDEQGLGGEYMVSAVVRGRPNEVLKVSGLLVCVGHTRCVAVCINDMMACCFTTWALGLK